MADLNAYMKSINTTKENIMRDEETDDPKKVSGYPAFLVRRLLSYHADVVLFANEMNCLPHLDSQLQYEYFLHTLPKKKRWGKMYKAVVPESLDLIRRYYSYSDEKALQVLDLHTETDMERMRLHLSEGGVIEKS